MQYFRLNCYFKHFLLRARGDFDTAGDRMEERKKEQEEINAQIENQELKLDYHKRMDVDLIKKGYEKVSTLFKEVKETG